MSAKKGNKKKDNQNNVESADKKETETVENSLKEDGNVKAKSRESIDNASSQENKKQKKRKKERSAKEEEEEKEEDVEWKDMTEKEFIDAYPLSTIEDKLDEDFIIYLQYASKLAEKGSNQCDFDKYKAWIEKLVTEPANTVEKKRTRNIYLSQLVLQIKEGKFSGVLADVPPKGPLIPAKEEFQFSNLPPKKTEHDLDTEVLLKSTDFQHVSQDGRTYLAAKSLPGGTGMCGYLAISIGEASKGLWLDSCGRPTKVDDKHPTEIPLNSTANYTKNEDDSTLNVEGSDQKKAKLSEEERSKLVSFYTDVLKRIDKIFLCFKENEDSIEIKDPLIKDMMNKIKCETPSVGGILCAPFNYHARTLLQALKRQVACKLEKIMYRANLIEDISSTMAVKEKEKDSIKLVDLSKNISDPNDDANWISAKVYKFSQHSQRLLNLNYNAKISETVQCLFERQKLKIYEQERSAHHEIMASYRSALVEEIREYIERYLEARKEWQRVHDVLKELERVRNEVLRFIKANQTDDSTDRSRCSNEVFSSATKDIEKQINEARRMSNTLDKEINEMRRRLHSVKSNYKEIYNKMKLTGGQWNEQIYRLQMEVKKQEKNIFDLKRIIQNSTANCSF